MRDEPKSGHPLDLNRNALRDFLRELVKSNPHQNTQELALDHHKPQ